MSNFCIYPPFHDGYHIHPPPPPLIDKLGVVVRIEACRPGELPHLCRAHFIFRRQLPIRIRPYRFYFREHKRSVWRYRHYIKLSPRPPVISLHNAVPLIHKIRTCPCLSLTPNFRSLVHKYIIYEILHKMFL